MYLISWIVFLSLISATSFSQEKDDPKLRESYAVEVRIFVDDILDEKRLQKFLGMDKNEVEQLVEVSQVYSEELIRLSDQIETEENFTANSVEIEKIQFEWMEALVSQGGLSPSRLESYHSNLYTTYIYSKSFEFKTFLEPFEGLNDEERSIILEYKTKNKEKIKQAIDSFENLKTHGQKNLRLETSKGRPYLARFMSIKAYAAFVVNYLGILGDIKESYPKTLVDKIEIHLMWQRVKKFGPIYEAVDGSIDDYFYLDDIEKKAILGLLKTEKRKYLEGSRELKDVLKKKVFSEILNKEQAEKANKLIGEKEFFEPSITTVFKSIQIQKNFNPSDLFLVSASELIGNDHLSEALKLSDAQILLMDGLKIDFDSEKKNLRTQFDLSSGFNQDKFAAYRLAIKELQIEHVNEVIKVLGEPEILTQYILQKEILSGGLAQSLISGSLSKALDISAIQKEQILGVLDNTLQEMKEICREIARSSLERVGDALNDENKKEFTKLVEAMPSEFTPYLDSWAAFLKYYE